MKMRSTVFLTLSLVVHAVCITALALSHFKSLESPNGSKVEVTMGDTAKTEESGKLADATEAKPAVQPEIKPIQKVEKAEAAKPLPKKVAPKKIVKAAKPATVLPAKAVAVEEPESMNPKIEDSDAVAVATPEEAVKEEAPKEETPKFIPVKEKVSAEAAEDTEDKTEAVSKELKVEEPAAPATSGKVENLGHGGDSKVEAVNYLELKQYSGNKSPEYPLQARKEQRQGQVELLYRVTKEGRVAEVQIAKSSGHSDLDEAAVKAISKYKFVGGQEGWARHPVIFTLKGVATALPSKLRTNSAATE